jgi:hypothetical protein
MGCILVQHIDDDDTIIKVLAENKNVEFCYYLNGKCIAQFKIVKNVNFISVMNMRYQKKGNPKYYPLSTNSIIHED